MLLESLKKLTVKIPFLSRAIRYKYCPADFYPSDKLYHGFRTEELDPGTSQLYANSIRFPDFSCNWNRFSKPADVRLREKGLPSDGCYSFTVENARYKKMATTCHDPIHDPIYENYAHVEIRQLLPNENVLFEPPKGRNLTKEKEGWSKVKKLEYRQHILYNLIREIEPTASVVEYR